jgi:hypothetical protein
MSPKGAAQAIVPVGFCAALSGLINLCHPRAYARGYSLPALRAWATPSFSFAAETSYRKEYSGAARGTKDE